MTTQAPQILLTPRDRELLTVLSLRVKLLSLDQARRTWWPDAVSDRELRRRLRLLESAGLVERARMVAGPSLVPTAPLATWTPGGLKPDFSAVATLARTRWDGGPRIHQVLLASAAGAHVVGGRARRSRPSEVTHDLHLAEVFLLFRRERAAQAERWVGEAAFSGESVLGKKVPDALLSLAGRCVAVEVCGASYTPGKLWEFHEYCASRRYGYELW